MYMREAIKYVLENRRTLDSNPCMMAAGYLTTGEFVMAFVAVDDDDSIDGDWVNVFVEYGKLDGYCAAELILGGETPEKVMLDVDKTLSRNKKLLKVLTEANFDLFNIDYPLGMMVQDTLFSMFPALPDPDVIGFNYVEFKEKAVRLIDNFNEK